MPSTIANSPRFKFLDANGSPAAYHLLYTYAAGSLTPKPTWKNQDQSTANTNPITLDAKGECLLWLDSGQEYKFVLKTPLGSVISTDDNISGAYYALSKDIEASTGSSLVGFVQSGAGAVKTDVQTELRQRVSVFQYGAIGDGVANDTAAIQACYSVNPARIIDHGSGHTFLVSETLVLSDNSTYAGASTIKGVGIHGAIIDGSGKSNVVIDGLNVDGNKAASGSYHGIQLDGGSNNKILRSRVINTLQAGIRAGNETNTTIDSNTVENCGADGYTDNHGIMIYATTGPASGVKVINNGVSGAYRKGIATYAGDSGVLSNVQISNNHVSGCGLGGIFTASAPGATHQTGVVVTNNVCHDNYVNMEIADLVCGVVDGNSLYNSTGSSGLHSADCVNTTITNNTIVDSKADGIRIEGQTIPVVGMNVSGNIIINSSGAGVGSYDGIKLSGVTYSSISNNVVLGESVSPKQRYGISEVGSSNSNLISHNKIDNAYVEKLSTVGSDTMVFAVSGKSNAINNSTPTNTLDVNGGISVRSRAITLANGANNNVTLPDLAGTLYVTGPTAAYSISGIAGGTSGKRITLVNYTTQTLTINHNSVNSTAGNKLLIGGAADLVLGAYGAVELNYISAANAWFVTGYKG